MRQDDSAPPPLPYEAQLASGVPRAKERLKDLISWTTLPLGSLIRVATAEPAIALTFDDGPDPVATPRVLDILERHGARGTFFLVGKSAARHPGIVARAVAAGHAVANHSWDHPSFRRIQGSYRRGRTPPGHQGRAPPPRAPPPLRAHQGELRGGADPLVQGGAAPPRRPPPLPPALRRAEPRLAARRPALRPSRGVLGRGGRGLAGRSGGAAGAAG